MVEQQRTQAAKQPERACTAREGDPRTQRLDLLLQRVGAAFQGGRLDPRTLTPQAILALQRAAGNTAVNRLLVGAPPQHAGGTRPASPQEQETVAQSHSTPGVAASTARDSACATDQHSPPPEPMHLQEIDIQFPMDADGDGVRETKRLFFAGEGETAQLMLNPDPLLFKAFLAKNQHLQQDATIMGLVASIRALLGTTLTITVGQQIAHRLGQLATYLGATFQVARPPSVATWTTRRIQHGFIGETVTDHLLVEPLSARPGQGFTGSGVQQSSTALMNELHNWSAGYVRGHMLNAKLHGPGVDKNLVPISSATNSAMAKGVEQYLKTKVIDKNGVVAYEIQPYNWGGFAGTGSAPNNAETILPADFQITVTHMRLAHAGDDGSVAANWVRKPGTAQDFSLTHASPGTTRYNPMSAPVLLGPGMYRLERGTWFQNTAQPGVWVVQDNLLKTSFSGGKETEIAITEPTNVAAAPYKGYPAQLEEIDQQLVVTAPQAAQDQLLHLEHRQDTADQHLTNRLNDSDRLLQDARQRELALVQALQTYQVQSQQRIADLQSKGIDATFLGAQHEQSWMAWHAKKADRDTLLTRAGLAVPANRSAATTERANIAAFLTAQRSLLGTNLPGFWRAQAEREVTVGEILERLSNMGASVRELNLRLEQLIRGQGFAPDEIARQNQLEAERYNAALGPWRSEQARKTQTERPAPTRYPVFDLDIDLSAITREFESGQLKLPEFGEDVVRSPSRTSHSRAASAATRHGAVGTLGTGGPVRTHTPRTGPYPQTQGPRDMLLQYARDLIKSRRTRVQEAAQGNFNDRAREYMSHLVDTIPTQLDKEQFAAWKAEIKGTIDELVQG